MSSLTYDLPLKLPKGWRATPVNAGIHQTNFPSTLTIDEAIRYMDDEAKELGMSVTLYTNYQQVNNARLRKQIGRSNGVSVVIQSGNDKYHFACDKWAKLEHNIYALSLAIRAFRNLEQWGIASIDFTLSSLFCGNHNNSSNINNSNSTINNTNNAIHSSTPDWMSALGLGTTATLEDANAVYRRRAKALADDENALIELNNSMDEARKYLR